MKTRYLLLAAALLLSAFRTAQAQPVPQTDTYPYSIFRIQSPPLTAPTNATASYGGTTPGGNTFSYWVYAVYIGGASGLSNRATVTNVGAIAGPTPVQISWAAQTGAVSYTVLKTTGQTQPTNGCSCVLASGLTVPRATDTGGALAAWTQPSSVSSFFGNFLLNQRDYATPTWEFTPPLQALSGQTYVNLDGTNSLTGSNEVVYLGTTGLEADDTFLYSPTAGNLTMTVKSATFPLADGWILRGFGAATLGNQYQYGRGTAAAPLYPTSGDGMANWNVQGWDEATASFATGGGIIVDAGTNWSATNHNAAMDFYINETGTTGNGITTLTLQPTMRVGVGYRINQLTGGLDGTLHVADNRLVTGDTSVVIQAGAGQAANLLAFHSAAGAAQTQGVRASFVNRAQNSALEPENCVAGIVGSQYFDTDDQRLCICANDGTDIEWVKSDDYTHATGHCTF